jgi:hypothetical protein
MRPDDTLTAEQREYVRACPGVMWTHPKTHEVMMVVPLPEISEPKSVTRARLEHGVNIALDAFVDARLARHRRNGVTNRDVEDRRSMLIEQCWTRDLLIVETDTPEHPRPARAMGVVVG